MYDIDVLHVVKHPLKMQINSSILSLYNQAVQSIPKGIQNDESAMSQE